MKDLSFAQFAKMYRSKGGDRKNDACEDENDLDLQEQDPNDEESMNKFHFVMSFDLSKAKKFELPKEITLQPSFQGENPMMRRRQFPAALRFHKKYKATDPLRFMFSEVMLYYPHKQEFEIDEAPTFYEESFDGKRKVDIVKSQVMEFLEDVTEARHFVEEILKEIDLEETKKTLDPNFVQENEECLEDGIVDHPDYDHINPEMIDENSDEIHLKSIYPRIEIQSMQSLKEKTRSLDNFQRHVVDIGVKFAKDIVKARNSHSKTPCPIFLMVHGGAGAGKSTVINVLAQWVHIILQKEGDNFDCPSVLKVAPTGTAASYIEGQTLHTGFSFSYDGRPYSLGDKARDQRREALRNLKMVSLILFIFWN